VNERKKKKKNFFLSYTKTQRCLATMSASLVRLLRMVTGGGSTARDARPAAPAAAVVPDEPRVVGELRDRLEARYGADRAPTIHRFVMRSRIAVQEASVCVETVFVVEDQSHRHLFEEGPAPAQLPLALVIERTAHDTTRMPVTVQLGLRGLRSQFAPPPPSSDGADDRSLSSEDALLAQIRDDLLDPQEKVRCVGGGRTLLSSVLVFDEPLSQTRFTSIDAIGFQVDFFFAHVATRVPNELAVRYQRLFWRRRDARSPGSSNKSLHGLAGGAHDFYSVPASYKYTPLLLSVHAYLSAHDAAGLARGTTEHELPTAHNCVLFEYGALHAAVDFIDEQLLGIHPRIYPHAFELTAAPFAVVDWQALYDERRTANDDDDNSDGVGTMEVLVEHCIYYAFISDADEPPMASVSPSRSHTPDSESEVGYVGAQPAGDDEEDEVSLNFQTPRSVHPTPRPSTLTGFFDLAIAAAVGAGPVVDSETLTDHGAAEPSPLLLKTPLRAQIGPLSPGRTPPRAQIGPLSPSRSPPLPPPQLILQQTHWRSVADVAGAAQSDDCSDASPADHGGAPMLAEQSSTSASIEARAILTRTILQKANQDLRAAAAAKSGVSA
jgi:hypothetical protein